MSYALAYYAILAVAVMIVPMHFRQTRSLDADYLKLLSTALMLALYIGGLLRSDGVDFQVYRENYLSPDYENLIPDLGFQALISVFRAMGLPFSALVVFIGLVSVAAMHRLARHFRIDLTLLILVWLLHLAIVRDLSQTRIGFAFSIAAFGLTASRWHWRMALYLLAASMHLSSLVFMLAYEFCLFTAQRPSRRSRLTWLGLATGIIFLAAASLSRLSFLDERIDLYLAWDASGYGAPVESYGTLFLHAFVLLVCALTRRLWHAQPEIRAIYYMEWLGVFTFLAFSSVAIFAFRLSNLLFSMYPIALLYALSRWQAGQPAQRQHVAPSIALYALALILLVRPGSFGVLDAIRFSGL